jgi:hypothetical protein
VNIKVIRNFRDGICRPIQGNLILKISNGRGKLAGRQQKEYTIVDVESNSEQEVLPDIEKYEVYDLTDVTGHGEYLYFSAMRQETTEGCIQEDGFLTDVGVNVSLMRYSVADGSVCTIYESKYFADEMSSQGMQAVVLDDGYLLMQITENVKSRGDAAYSRLKDIFLYDIANSAVIQVKDELLSSYGFETIVPLDGNVCAIKLGLSNYDYKLYGVNEGLDLGSEEIALINARQLISDLVLGKEQLPYEMLDTAGDGITFPYMRLLGGNLLYSRADLVQQREELILWDNVNRVSKVRVNDDLSRISKKNQIYQINDTLYFVQRDSKGTRLVNLNTHKNEWRLSAENSVVAIEDDLVVVSRHVKRGYFRKEADYVYVRKFSHNQETVLREKGRWAGCARTDNDELLIMMGN